jgi:protein-disulfide isomerase
VLALVLLLGALLAAPRPAAAEPLAEVDGEIITREEVETSLGPNLRRLQEQVYALTRQRLEAMIADRLLTREAARRGVSVPRLLDQEVTAKVGLVTEQEVETYYQANRGRLRGDESTAREQVRGLLQNQKLFAQRQAFVESLRARARVAVHLTPPPVVRVEVPAEGPLARGPASAPITLVEFTDFHCPFCKQVQPTVAALLARYGDRIRHVHRDFPLDQLHPQARKAHEAARCAADQGEFWAYHDLLFANAPRASLQDLKGFAAQLKLDATRFEECLTGGAHEAAVQRDFDEGVRLGVTGTPGFFVNGRALQGAQPLDRFIALIEEELTRAR